MFITSARQPPLPLVLLGILLAAAILVGFSAGGVVYAQSIPSIIISPTHGSPGERLTVKGAGFAPNATSVIIFFDGRERATERIGSDGTFDANFIIPSAPKGSKAIEAVAHLPPNDDGVRPQQGAVRRFTVESTARMSGKQGDVGSTFSIDGQGFGSREDIEVLFDGEDLDCGRARSASDGDIRFICQVPAVAAGDYEVEVDGEVLGTFAVTSTFSATPSAGPPGTIVQLKGTGFLPAGRVQITIGATSLTEAIINRDGALSTQVQIPAISGGPKVLEAASPGESGVQVSFRITPTLTAAPTATSPGGTIKVTGTAFQANERDITVRFSSATVGTGIVADSQGFWEANITVPSTIAGTHNITASGSQTTANVPTARVVVGAALTLSSNGGTPGTALTIRGSGAGSEEQISLVVGGGLFRADTQADRTGVWSAEIIIPSGPRGAMNVVARGTTSGLTTTKTFNILPSISTSSLKGTPGSDLTISGLGFGAAQTGIPITFGDDAIAAANANATGLWSQQITVPAHPSGTVFIKVPGVNADLQAPFTVVPVISVDRRQARTGESVTVTGRGFGANEPGITVKLGQTTVAQGITAFDNGSWTVTFTVPGLPSSSYGLTVSGFRTSPGAVAEASLELTRFLLLDPGIGHPGSTVAAAGHGFGAREQGITLTYSGQTVATGVAADATGHLTHSFVVPSSPGGMHTVTAVSATPHVGGNPVINFRVTPIISLSAGNGVSGEELTVTGAGFRANEPGIQVKFGDVVVVNGVSANPTGEINVLFNVPPTPGGQNLVSVSGGNGSPTGQLEQDFDVLPAISLSEAEGHVGYNLLVTGAGLGAGASIAVTYDEEPVASAVSDAQGSFTLPLAVPKSNAGEHVIGVGDGSGHFLRQTFQVENAPPAAPSLQEPIDGTRGGFFGGFQPTARWMPVEDPSGVSYTLQVARDSEFRTIFHEEEGLANPFFAFPENLALPRGKYFWRVQAVDQASNIGPYSDVYRINSGLIPVWLFSTALALLLMSAGAVGAFFYIRWQQRRPAVPAGPSFPEFVRISRPELAAPGAGSDAEPPAPVPARRALPSPFRRGGGRSSITPEQRAQLQLVTDFVQSIPLLEMSPDLRWMEELVENLGGDLVTAYDRLLNGTLEPEYMPMWMQHPTFVDMQELPAASSFLAGMQDYVDAVNECASSTMALLRKINADLDNAAPPEVAPDLRWRFIFSIAQSNAAWFRGTFLAQPSPRDYIVEPGAGPEDGALYGVESVPFKGMIMEGLPTIDLEFYRDLHIQLRNDYRNDESARTLVSRITATRALCGQLQANIALMGEQNQG